MPKQRLMLGWRWSGAMLMTGGLLAARLAAAQSGAAAPAHDPSAVPLAFRGVTVIDVHDGRRLLDQTVVLLGTRIQAVGPMAEIEIPKGAQVIDAKGKYLIPGLWDMHTHPGEVAHRAYSLLVANGVTGIRNAGSDVPLDMLRRWRHEILAGTRVGPPRQLLSGPSVNERRSCKLGGGACIPVGDTAAARRLVDSLRVAGADIIKTYDLSDRMYFAVAAAARQAGLPFGGHTSVSAIAASDSGAGILDHSTLNQELSANCLFGGATVQQCRPIAERFSRNNTWWVPTWVMPPHATGERSEAVYRGLETFLGKFWADSVAYQDLPAYLRGAGGGSPPPVSAEEMDALVHQPAPQGSDIPDSAGYLYVERNAGLPIMAGTDTPGSDGYLFSNPPGFSLQAELSTYVAEGLTPLEALQTATLNPAKFLHATDSLGTVASGKLADLVLLDADPLKDITNTATIRAVVANGRYFDRVALDHLLAEARASVRSMPTQP